MFVDTHLLWILYDFPVHIVHSLINMAVFCSECGQVFSTQSSLNRHKKRYHNVLNNIVSYDYKVFNSKCNECLCSFKFIQDLRQHLIENHNYKVETIEKNFETLEDFKVWLSSEEETNNVQYVKARGQKRNVIYYNCNRSITSKKAQNHGCRLPKSQGSCKVSSTCISQIKVDINEKVIVKYYKTHYNHEIEVQHLRILSKDRRNIGAKLKSGVTVKKVLNDIRDNISGPQLKRLDITTRKDINNIKTSFDIKCEEEGRRHTDDVLSIDLWVNEQENTENNCILFYKKQGSESDILEKNDFCLIIMSKSQEYMLVTFGPNIIAVDSTHGLNNYDFDLTTLMVVDEYGSGFPAACMFTNRKDTRVNEIFFSCIKNRLGFSIQAKSFMSDITGVFYNAWEKIMGGPCHQLYCSWHVDRACQSNLSKISNMEKRKWVYKTIKYLQVSLDETRFLYLLNKTIHLFKNDDDTKSFGCYFEKYYSDNCKLWAYCFRKSCNINRNMHLESMHKTLKYFYLDGRKVQRLDKGLHFLLKFIRDKSVERLIKSTKGKTTIHNKQIADRHRSAILNSNSFNANIISGDKCIVNVNNKSFEVCKVYNNICCNLDCKFCHICLHTYTCQCGVFYLKNTICEHIHFVAFNNLLGSNQGISTDKSGSSRLEMETHLDTLVKCHDSTTNNKINIQETIQNKMNEISLKCSAITDNNVLNEVLDYLKKGSAIIDIYKENTPFSVSTEKHFEPPNKKIKKQLTFHSTKKKQVKKNNFITKPSQEESTVINDVLHNRPYINKGGEDHDYL